ncbi:MAG: hypothetical protein H0X66_22035 [Verrucomicrobia bacterium]|jgi:hypothetical protein|nr:hypothetical protein [Verrucomicrobiota bacterium]
MKLYVQLYVGVGLVLLAIFAFTAHKSFAQNTTKEVMRFKLHYAQRILEGITMENYEVINDNAQKLKKLSNQAEWHIRETPEYQRFTTEFARHADALVKASQNENVDAATVAYFQMTVSCTSCHGYLRGVKGASLPLKPTKVEAQTLLDRETLPAARNTP